MARTLHATRANVAFVSETKSSLRKSIKVLDELHVANYTVVPARGRSGGLWLIWDQHTNLQIIHQNLSFIHAKIASREGHHWSLICIYGDPSHRHSKEIWQEIQQIINSEGVVCVIGDFNEIACETEKVGGNPILSSHNKQFRRFLSDAGLIDLGYKGPAYTWTNYQDTSTAIFQRLDRVVATVQWLNMYSDAYVNNLPRIHSDHAPILLRTKKVQGKAKGFKFENWWLNNDGFGETCQRLWDQSKNLPWEQRMNTMTVGLRRWAAGIPTPQNRLEGIQQNILSFQQLHPYSQDPRVEERLRIDYNKAEDDLQEYWRQRSRVQWHTVGDRNTTYFHAVATQRRRRNLITQVTAENGNIVIEDQEIMRVFVRFFKELYTEPTSSETSNVANYIQQCATYGDPTILDSDHQSLIASPSQEEIRENLFQMGPDKAPGPDGITARFLQTNWQLIKHDLNQAISTTFQTGQPPTSWLNSQLILIPKTDNPTTPKEYRPITIGNVVYRLLMKIVASRLQPHMQKLISTNQTAFLKNRCISDNSILIREIIHSFNSKIYLDQTFLLKADINKAFDTVKWEFIAASLKAVNMPTNITRLIMTSMAASRVKILINGKGDGFITPTRGVRQGCPLSPYLFILVMEMLTRRLNRAQIQGCIAGIKLAPTAPVLTNILYADDLVIMGKTTTHEAREYKQILKDFGQQSGLFVNPQKSKVWFSNKCDENCKQVIERELGAQPARNGEKYLGIIMTQDDTQHKLTRDMLVERVGDKLASWKVNTLSQAGKQC